MGMPDEFYCPELNRELAAPILRDDGHTYEKKSDDHVHNVKNKLLHALVQDFRNVNENKISSMVCNVRQQAREAIDLSVRGNSSGWETYDNNVMGPVKRWAESIEQHGRSPPRKYVRGNETEKKSPKWGSEDGIEKSNSSVGDSTRVTRATHDDIYRPNRSKDKYDQVNDSRPYSGDRPSRNADYVREGSLQDDVWNPRGNQENKSGSGYRERYSFDRSVSAQPDVSRESVRVYPTGNARDVRNFPLDITHNNRQDNKHYRGGKDFVGHRDEYGAGHRGILCVCCALQEYICSSQFSGVSCFVCRNVATKE
jgi:hypothetical protein